MPLEDTKDAPDGAVDFAKLFDDQAAAGATLATESTPEPAAPVAEPPASVPSGGEQTSPAGGTGEAGAAPPAETPPAETPPSAAPPVAEPSAAPADGDGKTPPAGVAAEPPAAVPPAAPSADDIVKGLTDLLKNPPAPDTPAPAAETPPDAPMYSAEEQQVLQDFEKNWPDVHRAQLLQRRAEYSDIMKFMFTSVVEYMKEPLEVIRAMQNTLHEGEVRQALPDYTPELETQVAAWVETQPAYLQAPMKQVMQTGTRDEVVDLFQRYKASTGVAPAAQAQPVVPPPPPAATPRTELSQAAKQAAESLAPVSAERTNVPQGGVDPNDFEGGFAHWAAEGAKI